MNLITILKVVGIVDGALVALITAVGQFIPAWSPVCTFLAIALGSIGTVASGIAGLLAPSSSG